MLAAILTAESSQTGTPAPGGGGAPVGAVNDHLERTNRIIAAAADPADMRRRMGAASLELQEVSGGSWPTRWRDTVAARLPSRCWPERPVLITAVDAETGEGVAFDRNSGIDLVDAVAASTSPSLPYTIGDKWYIDGGYRRNENADLAFGYARVLVLSPFGGRSRHPVAWRMHLEAQIEDLRAGGSEVATVFPDVASISAFGGNMMDLSARPPAARAGYGQGSSLAEQLTAFWR